MLNIDRIRLKHNTFHLFAGIDEALLCPFNNKNELFVCTIILHKLYANICYSIPILPIYNGLLGGQVIHSKYVGYRSK